MHVSISGSSGFIGKELIGALDKGMTFTVINRDSFSMSDDEFLENKIEGKDAVINLAGAPIIKKWNQKVKDEIYHSRIDTTTKIANAIINAVVKPKVFISCSAIGIYSTKGIHNEESTDLAVDFLGKVVKDWEAAAFSAKTSTRVVVVRTGIVYGNTGGVLEMMEKPFRWAVGGKIGKGTQPVSWIHIRDLINVYKFIIENEAVSGVINAVSPNPTTNAYFTSTFAKVLNQPAVFTIPHFALKALYGEAAGNLIEGQTVLPEKLLKYGFHFQYPTVEKALLNLYKHVI